MWRGDEKHAQRDYRDVLLELAAGVLELTGDSHYALSATGRRRLGPESSRAQRAPDDGYVVFQNAYTLSQ
jgi:hypothetical protein